MEQLSFLPSSLFRSAFLEIQEAVLPQKMPKRAKLELSITLDDTGIGVRDLANYLRLIDGVYGRLDPRGFRSYAQREDDYLRIDEVRPGSMEVVISQLLATTERALPLVVLFILLKYLPEFLKNLASAFKDFEEARHTRLRRSQLSETIKADKTLQSISEGSKQHLIEFLDDMYASEASNLRGARRVAELHLKELTLRVVPDREAAKQES
jgi:hypothetical protein